MKTFWKLLQTEWKRIFSNRVLVMIFFGAPVLYGLLFIQVYKKGKITDMPVVVIDEDRTALSGRIIDALDENENLKVVQVRFDAGNIAAEMPSKEYVAVISIPAGFESAVLQKKYPEIMTDINTANLVTANFASRAIQTVLGTIGAGIEIEGLKKAGMDATTAAQRYEPFKVNYSRFYNPSGNYQDLMIPGLMGTIMQQVILLALGLVFARDFEDGYFKQLVSASGSAAYHILLKSVPFVLLIGFMWLLVHSFYPVFRIDMTVFSWPMAALVAAFSLACMFLGMLFSLAIPNQLRATELLMVIATPSFLLSGYTWPLEAMPDCIAKIAGMLPLTQFLQGFRKLAIYGGTLNDALPHMLHLLLAALILAALMMILLRRKIKRTKKEAIAAVVSIP
ncbi:ABC transporter permease [Niabella sp.]|uniref:ABC transporter permease n=1 Tax=Niabella sp. TaxID=1962976 RepID=UPI002627AD62|nr:ABC transporter permease [Niabella sp.]